MGVSFYDHEDTEINSTDYGSIVRMNLHSRCTMLMRNQRKTVEGGSSMELGDNKRRKGEIMMSGFLLSLLVGWKTTRRRMNQAN